ncbi:MAG: xanthine dehydrogenase family protein molybdopterin-binding subunit, partial [Sphingomonadales bacterium]|nr:xanthine dehydrogenase family protein molybdopterin-binding subunit [Sphingomonadales bacterium]
MSGAAPSPAPHARGTGAARYIGQRVLRKEDPRLLTGRGQFVDDITLPGMLHVAFARSPIARGRITAIDTGAARDIAGVHAIFTQADLDARRIEMLSFFLVPVEVPVTPLADGRVAYAGEPVALVIADSRAIAEDAAALIEVSYEEEPAVVTLADARSGAPVHPGTTSNISAEMGDAEVDEDLAAALAGAAHRITHRVTHQRISQSPMETRGVVASRDGPEELTLYITCQSPHMIARWVGMALGLPHTAIRVIAKDVGGSFGLKNHPWKEECAVIVAALLFGRPLKWIEDRYENLTAANQAREAEMTLQIGFDSEGRLLASHADYSSNNGAFPQGADCNVAVQMFLWSAYRMPAFGFLARGWYSNTVGLAAYRGPWAMESLARETALDIAARRMKIDPIDLRRRNLIRLADQPTTSVMGLPLEDITPAECLDKLLAAFDVAAFRAEQEAARKHGRHLGLGIATYIEPTGSAGSMAPMTGELAQIRIDPTGKVTAMMSTHSQGHGTATTMAQLIAERLGVAYEDVTVFEGDSSRGGFSPGAAGSRQGVIAGGAAISASDLLADKVRRLAAHLLNASPETIRLEGGMVHVEGAPEMSRELGEIAAIAYAEPHRLPEGFEPGLEAQFRYQPPPMTFTSAAHACVVEVDADTGFVKILRWISSEDCGTVINPAVVEGQIAGGLAQAIGTVLLEDFHYDAAGNPTSVTYKDYLLPAISDVPVFEYVHANTPSRSVGGMRGVGEGGAIIGPPTLVNAIADALAPFGEVPVDLPLTPAKLLGIIERRDIAGTSPAPPPVAAQPEAPAASAR